MPHLLENNPPSGGSSNDKGRELVENLSAVNRGEEILKGLDASLNGHGGAGSSASATTSRSEPRSTGEDVQSEEVETGKGEHDYEKRYKDSSRENRKYRERLESIEPVLPLVDALLLNPELMDTVRKSINGQNVAEPKEADILEELGLDDGFEFDLEEAIADKNSDSGKALRALINRETRTDNQNVLRAVNEMFEIRDFKDRNKMSDEDFEELVAFSKKMKLDWDTINTLRSAIEGSGESRGAAPGTSKHVEVKPSPRNAPSLSSVGGKSGAEERDPTKIVLNAILASNRSSRGLAQFEK